MKKKTITLPITDIINHFDCRKALDDDNILRLAEAYQAGEDVPAITVIKMPDGKYAFEDGRHRVAARALLNLTDVECVIKEYSTDRLQLYSDALKANYGGSKPPTKEDISHTIQRMVEEGGTEASIVRHLDFMPRSIVVRYINDARGKVKKKRISMALSAIGDGMGVGSAAKQYHLSEQELREAISGKKRKWGTSKEGPILAENKNYVGRVLKAANVGISKKIEFMLQQVEDGELGPETVHQVIDHWHSRLSGTLHRIKDWKERVDASVIKRDSVDEEQESA